MFGFDLPVVLLNTRLTLFILFMFKQRRNIIESNQFSFSARWSLLKVSLYLTPSSITDKSSLKNPCLSSNSAFKQKRQNWELQIHNLYSNSQFIFKFQVQMYQAEISHLVQLIFQRIVNEVPCSTWNIALNLHACQP